MGSYAVVLMNLGGPDSLDAIEPFLFNLFSDPDIFSIPIGQRFVARMIARKRAPKVRKNYALIGGSSPVNEWTEKQRILLQEVLRKDHPDLDVFTAMRYWKPFTEDTLKKMEEKVYDKIILLPLYPHYSKVTGGSSFKRWDRLYTGNREKVVRIREYYDHPLYIKALNERITKALYELPTEMRESAVLLFSAHGVPQSLIKKGDPYKDQIEKTAEAVIRERDDLSVYHLCYQSKVGPVKWLGPDVSEKLTELREKGIRDVIIVPISFVSDHVETIYELGIEYKETADALNYRTYKVTEGLNDSPFFIDALQALVKVKIEEKSDD